jgi:hypothetical protein
LPLDLSKLDPSSLALTPSDEEGRARDHFVEIYEQDDSMVDSLERFVSLGIEADEVVIVVATPEHRGELEERLGDVATARLRGLYRAFDAADILARVTVDGVPDAESFDREVGKIVEAAARGGRKVRVFGEMVALLWEREECDAAIVLEDLWNRLAERHPFRLFCSYPSKAFREQDVAEFQAMCLRHSHVIAPPR